MIKKFIYALFDPRDPSVIRYVGCTKNLQDRLKMHAQTSGPVAAGQKEKALWIRDLQSAGLSFGWKLLETVDANRAVMKEKDWIAQFASPLLFNKTVRKKERLPRDPNKSPKLTFSIQPVANPLTLLDAERNHLIKIINDCNGKKSLAAKVLGISRPTLYEKMAKHAKQ